MSAVTAFVSQVLARSGTVLIHCRFGLSRGAAATLAVLMSVNRMTLRAACCLLTARREDVRPSKNFFEDLILLEQQLLGASSVRIEEWQSLFSRNRNQNRDVIACPKKTHLREPDLQSASSSSNYEVPRAYVPYHQVQGV